MYQILLTFTVFDNDLDIGFPDDARDENDISNSWSISRTFCTKYWNFLLKILMAWSRTERMEACPAAIRFNCFSRAARIVGNTNSGSICVGRIKKQGVERVINKHLQRTIIMILCAHKLHHKSQGNLKKNTLKNRLPR